MGHNGEWNRDWRAQRWHGPPVFLILGLLLVFGLLKWSAIPFMIFAFVAWNVFRAVGCNVSRSVAEGTRSQWWTEKRKRDDASGWDPAEKPKRRDDGYV